MFKRQTVSNVVCKTCLKRQTVQMLGVKHV